MQLLCNIRISVICTSFEGSHSARCAIFHYDGVADFSFHHFPIIIRFVWQISQESLIKNINLLQNDVLFSICHTMHVDSFRCC